MFTRLHARLMAGGSALALAIAVSSIVAAGSILTVVASAPTAEAPVVDTTATFEDLNGNGVDDDCETDVVADAVAAASAEAAADLDGDGTISTSEAAHSGRTGGKNCNHGGYVSGVAKACETAGSADETTTSEDADTDADTDADEAADENEPAETTETADCSEDTTTADPAEDAPTTCEAAPADETTADEAATETTTELPDLSPNGHGKQVSAVARSTATGGKNCNHGGAVSEAAKKDHEAARLARDAAKAEREAARAAEKAARDAAHASKHHGKPGG